MKVTNRYRLTIAALAGVMATSAHAQTLAEEAAVLAVGAEVETQAIPQPAAAPETPSESVGVQQASLPPAELPGTPTSPPAEQTILKRKGSVMFSEHDLELYYEAVGDGTNISTANVDGALLPGELPGATISADGAVAAEAPLVKPNFRLGSIVYFDPESWSIWINNTRIRNSKPTTDEPLKVLNVHERAVEFVWQTDKLDLIAPNWRQNFVSTGGEPAPTPQPQANPADKTSKTAAFVDGNYNWDYISSDGRVLIDSTNGIVKVSLGLYQTFVSADMKVVEGAGSIAATTAPSPVTVVPAEAVAAAPAIGADPTTPAVPGDAVPASTIPAEANVTATPGQSTAAAKAAAGDAPAAAAPSTGNDEFDTIVKDVFKN